MVLIWMQLSAISAVEYVYLNVFYEFHSLNFIESTIDIFVIITGYKEARSIPCQREHLTSKHSMAESVSHREQSAPHRSYDQPVHSWIQKGMFHEEYIVLYIPHTCSPIHKQDFILQLLIITIIL